MAHCDPACILCFFRRGRIFFPLQPKTKPIDSRLSGSKPLPRLDEIVRPIREDHEFLQLAKHFQVLMNFPHQWDISKSVRLLAHDWCFHSLQVEWEGIASKRLKLAANWRCAGSLRTPPSAVGSRKKAEVSQV